LSTSSVGPVLFLPGLDTLQGPGAAMKTNIESIGENWAEVKRFQPLAAKKRLRCEGWARTPGAPPPAGRARTNTDGHGQTGKALRAASEASEGDGAPGGAEVGAGGLAAWKGRLEAGYERRPPPPPALREWAGGGRLDGVAPTAAGFSSA
jgi:hypothetical protein